MKIAAKKIALSHYPTLRAERQRGNGPGDKPYYLIRFWDNGSPRQDWSSCGDTEAKAWADFCDRRNLTALKEIK